MCSFVKSIYNSTKRVYTSMASLELPSTQTKTKQPNGSYSTAREELGRLCRENRLKEALDVLSVMDQRGIPADFDTYISLLQACGNMKALKEGKEVHAHMLSTGFDKKIFLMTKLVSMYAICGSMVYARHVFEKMPKRNACLCNAMIRGYARNGLCEEALLVYYKMQQVGLQPDYHTFSCVLKACAGLSALQEGKEIHNHIMKGGFESGIFIGNALIDMYAKCGKIKDARQTFDKMTQRDVVSWNAMIAGYTQNGYYSEALELFSQMKMAAMKPNMVTLASVLPACANLADLLQGKEIHQYIIRSGFDLDVFVGSTLIDMYAKCNSVDDSRQVFDKMCERDVALWNAMIAGYAHNGYCNEALSLFRQMQLSVVKLNPVTIASIMPACAQLAVMQYGKAIHAHIVRSGFESNVFVGTSVIDMYAKCGNIELARQVFGRMSRRDVVAWTAMIAGYGMHGYREDVLTLFNQMQQEGMKADHITFVAVLAACSHVGLMNEGWQYFTRMSQDHHIMLGAEHYACMVDLLGRSGHVDEAYNFIRKMPLEPSAGVWGALLGACRIHCNVELGEHVAEQLFELDPENEGYYVLLSNIYAAAGRWDGVAKVRIMMKDRGLKKKPGCSWIEVKNRVHAFVGGDRSHPESEKIYATLESLSREMKNAGYAPDTNFVLDDVKEEEKEHILFSHSEKLAIAFGLIHTFPGIPIRITKNLRVCGDCHSATKFISKIVGREIIVRDMNRFHRFKDGLCSCGDYW
eukprot:Gb_04419 [translate_table: standard]